MGTRTIQLTVTDEKLEVFKKEVESLDGGQVTNPLLLLQLMLQQEVENADVYADQVMDSGGNCMGDVFWDESVYADCYIDRQDS